MHIRPTPFNCAASGCDGFVRRLWQGGWIIDVCGDCALRINSLISCPRADPYPDPKPVKKSWSQSKEAQKREILKAKMMQAAKKESYQAKITRLKKEYKK